MPVTTHGRSTRHRLQTLDLLELSADEAVVAQVDDALLHEAMKGAHPGNSLHTTKFWVTHKYWERGGKRSIMILVLLLLYQIV